MPYGGCGCLVTCGFLGVDLGKSILVRRLRSKPLDERYGEIFHQLKTDAALVGLNERKQPLCNRLSVQPLQSTTGDTRRRQSPEQ
jgi:hypothetical protein